MSKTLTLMSGPFTVRITPKYFVFSVGEGGRASAATRERLGPPRFRAGRRADHFTWPRHPLCGNYNLHLTYEDGDHHTVLALDPRHLVLPAEEWMRRIRAEVAASFRLVSLAELHEAGWWAVLPSASLTARLDQFVQQPPKAVRLKPRDLRHLAHDLKWVDPLDLGPSMTARAPVQLLREVDETVPLDAAWLKYMPHGMSDGHAGWYLLPRQGDVSQRFFDLAPRELVEPFCELFFVVARELEAEVKLDLLDSFRRSHSTREH